MRGKGVRALTSLDIVPRNLVFIGVGVGKLGFLVKECLLLWQRYYTYSESGSSVNPRNSAHVGLGVSQLGLRDKEYPLHEVYNNFLT